jgi:glycine/D-amino acid oxidase-like deaminating enzyme
MLIDLRQLAGDERFEADVCVVGAGAAGISLARELAARGRSVLLVESGGFEYEQSTQALYGGDETGTLLEEGAQYLASTRLRYFGGTTNHWNGWCRPLDDEDLDSRPWVAEVDWPLSRDDLMPFYHRACPVVQISPFDYEDESAGMAPKLFDGDDEVFATTYFHLSPPTRFSALYRAELETSERIRVLLHANLRRLDVDPASGHVRGAEAARLDGTLFPLTARHYVLAAGVGVAVDGRFTGLALGLVDGGIEQEDKVLPEPGGQIDDQRVADHDPLVLERRQQGLAAQASGRRRRHRVGGCRTTG